MTITRLHHIAIICSDYRRSLHFYTELLGLKLEQEIYREERQSWKADLSLHGRYLIELFSFPEPPPRPTQPEARGLRHLAFAVADIEQAIVALGAAGIDCEPIRIDPHTAARFTFLRDPDDLPIELYEVP